MEGISEELGSLLALLESKFERALAAIVHF